MTVVFDFDHTLIDSVRLRAVLEAQGEAAALSRCGEFLFSGSADMLGRLRQRGAKLILLTFGQDVWQREKVRHAGIEHFFDEIITTEEAKHGLMDRFSQERPPVVFVNDNIDEVAAMRQAAAGIPGAAFIIKRGPKEPSAEALASVGDLPVAESLAEVEALLDYALHR